MKNQHTARYIDSGFYILSDAGAGALCAILGQPLPREGYAKFVMLECPHGPVNAWLQRTTTSHSCRTDVKNARGWHWAIYSIRKDSAEYLPALGESFAFTPIKSTVPEAVSA